MFIAKFGNPIIRDESEESRRVYNSVRDYVQKDKRLRLVQLLPDKLFIESRDFVKTYKYPKNADICWLFSKLETCYAVWERQYAYRHAAPQTREFVELATKLVKEGATVDLIDDVVYLRYKTFVGKMGCFSAYHEIIRNDLTKLIDQTAELARLHNLAKQHGLI